MLWYPSALATFSLKRIPFPVIADHVRRNAGVSLSPAWAAYPCLYLSNFYARPGARAGAATAALKGALRALDRPVLLWCEPVLGTDPRAVTVKNAEMTADERYAGLCEYYRVKFDLVNELAIDCTLKTELTGHGTRWTDADRKLMWGLQG